MNQVALVGRITKDLTLREHSSGRVSTMFTLAINRTFKNSSGEAAADFVPCIVWGRTAENLVRHCGKGSLVGVSGSIQTRNYERDSQTKVYITEVNCAEIRFLSSKRQTNDEKKAHSQTEASRFTQGKAADALPIF